MSEEKIDSSNEDALKYLRNMVPKSGFSLESDVAKLLSSQFKVQREVSFYDKDGKTTRAIDLVSRWHFPEESKFESNLIRHIGSLNLIIECKNLPGNIWLFSNEQDPGLTIPNYLSLTDSLGKNDPTRKIIPSWFIPNAPIVGGYDEYVFDKSKSNSKIKDPKNLYSAINTVIKATSSNNDQFKKTFDFMKSWTPQKQNFIVHFAFFQPVVVFSGKLFVAKYVDEKLDYEQTSFVQLPVDYQSEHYEELSGTIHIITYEYLQNYLEIVKKYYSLFSSKIIELQNDFRSAKKSII